VLVLMGATLLLVVFAIPMACARFSAAGSNWTLGYTEIWQESAPLAMTNIDTAPHNAWKWHLQGAWGTDPVQVETPPSHGKLSFRWGRRYWQN